MPFFHLNLCTFMNWELQVIKTKYQNKPNLKHAFQIGLTAKY